LQATVASRDQALADKEREITELRSEKNGADADEGEDDEPRSKKRKTDPESKTRSLLKRFTLCSCLWAVDLDSLTGPLRQYDLAKFVKNTKDRNQVLARDLRAIFPDKTHAEFAQPWFHDEVRRAVALFMDS
jgi:hypothetical protein